MLLDPAQRERLQIIGRPTAAWSRLAEPVRDDMEAAFLAGGALAVLDATIRLDAATSGVWRCRLALAAAAASVRMIGRAEDEAALRDAWCLRRPGDAMGPAGDFALGWRGLIRQKGRLSLKVLRETAEAFGLHVEDILPDVLNIAEKGCRNITHPLGAAATAAFEVYRLRPQAEMLGLWLADFVLARRLRWENPLPLLVTHVASAPVRSAAGRRSSAPGGEAWDRLVAIAYAQASVKAVGLANDLIRRGRALAEIAPKLRAKGAGLIVTALTEEDALAPSDKPNGMSDRAMRRLCDRLVTLGGARELTGRSFFRLYGL